MPNEGSSTSHNLVGEANYREPGGYMEEYQNTLTGIRERPEIGSIEQLATLLKSEKDPEKIDQLKKALAEKQTPETK